ncbi:HotDog domain-containing protein [Flammula alnicola]|nr:HotDog domain-containing protein [Flammula alnicola]
MDLPSTTTLPKLDVSQVAGNASEEIKRLLGDAHAFYASFSKPGQQLLNIFASAIEKRMKKAEEPNKLEGRAVIEIEVSEDMVNGSGNIHGGCSAYLIDMASSFALAALSLHETGKLHPSVSQALNVVYHSPAGIGEKLRLVNTTLTVGKRAESVRTEIWNITHRRLVATGVHIKMVPSPPPKPAL